MKPLRCQLRSAAMLAVSVFICGAPGLSLGQLPPPGPVQPRHQAITVSPTILAGYVGSYQLSSTQVVTVTLQGAQLYAQLTGQRNYPIYAESHTRFFFQVAEAELSFVTDSTGMATSVELQQGFVNSVAPRISASDAAQINRTASSRIAAQIPQVTSLAALQAYFSGVQSGNPNYAEMSSALALATQQQMPSLQALFLKLGAVTNIAFQGVGSAGRDVYVVIYENGQARWSINVGTDGVTQSVRMLGPPTIRSN